MSTVAGFDTLEADWRRLENADPALGVFNGWEANRIWWRHHHHLGELSILVVQQGERVVAIAPFYRTRTVLVGLLRPATVRFIGRGGRTTPDDLQPLFLPGSEQAAIECFGHWLVHASGATRWLLEDLPAAGKFTAAILALSANRHQRVTYESRRLATLPDSVAAWRASLSRNSRKHLSRRRRQADDAGSIEYRLATCQSLAEGDFERLIELHRNRRSALADGSSFESPEYIAFHREFCATLCERGLLRLAVLSLDGRAIGVEYALRHRDTLVFLQTGFDSSVADISPGHLLMTFLIEHAIAEGVTSLDLLKGDYAYKASYAPDTRESVTLDVVRSRALGWLITAVDAVRLKIASPQSKPTPTR